MAAKMERTRYPGIFLRGDRYVVVWRHRGRQHKEAFRSLDLARAAQGDRRRHDGRRPPARERFEDYAREWIDTYAGRTKRGIGDLTLGGYRSSLELYAIPYFRRWRLADVEPPDVRQFVKSLEAKGLSPASVRKILAPVRAMFATALEDGTVRTNPTAGVRVTGRRNEDEDRKVAALTREELASLLAAVPEEWRLFFELLAHTGLRISELLGLQWRDVQFGARPTLLVRRQVCRRQERALKTSNARRDLPLSPRMAQRLWVLSRGREEREPVFASARGTPLNDSNVRYRVLSPAAVAAGLPWVTFHSFRHTCASLLFEEGRNARQVCDWLGHADPGFTLRTYVHLMDVGLGDADFLDAAVAMEGGNGVATCHPSEAATQAAVSDEKGQLTGKGHNQPEERRRIMSGAL